MIRKILIEGVRTHERTEIELSRLTCLVGPNGSGKSTLLQAIHSFNADAGFPAWQRSSASTWKIELEDHTGSKVVRAKGTEPSEVPNASWFRFDSEILRLASEAGVTQLGSQGHHLAAVLANWKLSEEHRFVEIVEQLKIVVPTIENLRPKIVSSADKTQFELIFDFKSATAIPARAVSEGTLLALGLIAAVHQIGGSWPVILLDDIDRGLHPDAQVELIGLIRKVAEIKQLQVIMTTHSPFIVDALTAEEVCVLALDDTGTTRARRLSEIPGSERYRGMLSTGQLWSSHGESWVLEEKTKSKAS